MENNGQTQEPFEEAIEIAPSDPAGGGPAPGGGELPFGLGEYCYLPTNLVSFLVAEAHRKEVEAPTLLVWYCPKRYRWCGVLHHRSRRCSAFWSDSDLPALFAALGRGLRDESLAWRGDRREPR